MSTAAMTFTTRVHFEREEKGTLVLAFGEKPKLAAAPVGRVPKLARLMALAIRFEDLLKRGEVKDYAELARVRHVTRTRVTQIMNLLCLAPDIQEQVLFLPLTMRGADGVKEWQVRPIAAEPAWEIQRKLWRRLRRELSDIDQMRGARPSVDTMAAANSGASSPTPPRTRSCPSKAVRFAQHLSGRFQQGRED
jgi:hypothetical protein